MVAFSPIYTKKRIINTEILNGKTDRLKLLFKNM